MLMAFRARDVSEIETLVDDRCIGVGVTGTEYTKADFIRDHYGKIFVNSFDVIAIKVVEEESFAVVLADWEVDLVVDKSILQGRVRATRTWAKRRDGWKMISFHIADARLVTAWEQVTKK
jgi:hypothetical protein